jgi:hypothetical protein
MLVRTLSRRPDYLPGRGFRTSSINDTPNGRYEGLAVLKCVDIHACPHHPSLEASRAYITGLAVRLCNVIDHHEPGKPKARFGNCKQPWRR